MSKPCLTGLAAREQHACAKGPARSPTCRPASWVKDWREASWRVISSDASLRGSSRQQGSLGLQHAEGWAQRQSASPSKGNSQGQTGEQ